MGLKFSILASMIMTHLFSTTTYSHSEPSIRVLVVGAGPSGLAVAKALQNKGIYPDIIEKEDKIRADGAGIAIPANGSWALNKLRIDITKVALLIHEMQFTDDEGELLIKENIEHIHPASAQFYSLGRNELINQMLSSLHDNTLIQTATTIKQFFEENDEVRIEFSNGEIKHYDLVIGCDGIHSTLRSQVHPDERPEFLGLLVWRAMIDLPCKIALPTYMLGADRALLLYPMPEGKTYVYGHKFQAIKKTPTEPFVNEFSFFGGPAAKVIDYLRHNDNPSKDRKFYIHHMEKSHSIRFSLGGFKRILLVGDAAHAFGPMLQNGAAQAFEDAYVLQELLNNTVTTKQLPKLLKEFEKRRLPRVEKIFAMSNAKIQAISDPKQIWGRNEAIRKMGAPNVNAFKLIMQENP